MATETGCGVGAERKASRSASNGFVPRILASGMNSEDSEKVSRNYSGVYRYTMLAIWLGSSLVMILDRFFWNVWPRQSICTNGCGTDVFCDMDVDPGCLQEGPWSVKVFDVIARVSSRLIISTTTLLFGTMCHGTWNYLSEVGVLRPFLHGWRGDNFWLHTVGGWSIGIWVIAHVWSLLLPSVFHGFRNIKVPGQFGWLPPQVPIPGGNLNAADKEARWGLDDIWRIFWMTVIFGALMPLSRSAWAQRKNFSLAMVLHTALGAGFFIDSVRRKTHPHVWILNTPVVIWYIADKIWCATRGRVNPLAKATRVVLDDEYMLLLWTTDDKPKRICDIFWLKQSHTRLGKGTGRVGELAHPFTTCSSHGIVAQRMPGTSPSHQQTWDLNARPIIEVPIQTDVSWPGHRFSLNSAATFVSQTRESARGSTISGLTCGHGVRALTKSGILRPGDSSCIFNETLAGADMGEGGSGGRSEQSRGPDMGAATDSEAVESGSTAIVSRHPISLPASGSELNFSPSPRGLELARSEQGDTLQGEEKFDRDGDEDTMIGADSGGRPGGVALVIGSVGPCNLDTGRSIVTSSVKRFNSQAEGDLESHQRDSLNEREDGTGTNVTNPTTTRTATPTVVANQTASTSDVSSWLPEDAIMQPLPRPRMSQPLPAVDTSEPEPIHPTKCTQHTRRAQQTPRTKFVQWIEWARWDKWTKWAGWTGRSKCRVGHALELLDCENGGHVNVTSAAAAEGAAGGKRAGLKRLDTPLFQQYRNAVTKGVEREGLDLEGRSGRVPVQAWNKMAIVRIHRPKKEPKVRECTCMGITHVVSSFRRAETASIADCDTAKGGGSAPLRTYGPYRSDYGRLGEFPNLPPLLIIATGAGAALALDFVAFVRANKLMPRRPVKVCYSSASLALLQFVTNTLLAESTPGIEIKTALTRHDELQVFDTATEPKEDLVIGRLDVKALVEGVSDDTEVYFCGGGTINILLRETCARRNMAYTGSSVQ